MYPSINHNSFYVYLLIIHSIKGNSGNIGAEDLYYNARRLERRAKEKDGTYVDAAAELFFMEWERAKDGLKAFLAEFTI